MPERWATIDRLYHEALELVEGDTLAERVARSQDRALQDPRLVEGDTLARRHDPGGAGGDAGSARHESGRGRPLGRPLSLGEVLNIARQIADALEPPTRKGSSTGI